MKINQEGINEIKNTIETPIKSLAKHLEKNKSLDRSSGKMISFILDHIQKIGENGSNWEIIK